MREVTITSHRAVGISGYQRPTGDEACRTGGRVRVGVPVWVMADGWGGGHGASTGKKHQSKPLSPLKRQRTCPTQLPDMLHIRSCMHSTHTRTTVWSSSRYNCSLATLGRRSHASRKRRHRVLGPVAPEACAEDPWSSLVLLNLGWIFEALS